MKLINIGFSSLVAAGRVLAIMDPDSAPIKRVVQEAKERGMLIDASYGRKTKAVLLMDTDHVILSALTPDTLSARWAGKESQEEEPEYELFCLTLGLGEKLRLYKLYKKRVNVSKYCDLKVELYALCNEIDWWMRLGDININYIKMRSRKLIRQMKKNKLKRTD